MNSNNGKYSASYFRWRDSSLNLMGLICKNSLGCNTSKKGPRMAGPEEMLIDEAIVQW